MRVDISVIRALANMNRVDYYSGTPLHWASERDSTVTVNQLFDLGADWNSVDAGLGAALHFACEFGHLDTASVLIRHDA